MHCSVLDIVGQKFTAGRPCSWRLRRPNAVTKIECCVLQPGSTSLSLAEYAARMTGPARKDPRPPAACGKAGSPVAAGASGPLDLLHGYVAVRLRSPDRAVVTLVPPKQVAASVQR